MMRWFTIIVGVLLALALCVGAASANHTKQVTINGSVTGVNETAPADAHVLIGDDSMLAKFETQELRSLARSNPQNLTVVTVDKDGTFQTSVGSRQAQAALAISKVGISKLVYVRGEDTTIEFQLYRRRPQRIHSHIGSISHEEDRTELYVNLLNNGNHPIENLAVQLVSIPDGWTITAVNTTGSYHRSNRTIRWSKIPTEAEVDTTVVVAAPDGTSPGEYRVELRATSETHMVSATTEMVEVLPKETPGPTTSPPPVDDGNKPTPEATTTTIPLPTTTGSFTPSTTAATGPGLGIVAIIGVLLAASSVLYARIED